MDQRELKQLLASVGLAVLIAGVAAVGCAHAEKSSDGGGQNTQGRGASSCGGAGGCGGKGGCGGSKK